MPRERREFSRGGFKKKYQRLFVIATEGEKTENKYFKDLSASSIFHDNKVFVEILITKDGKSAPKHIIARLNGFKREFIVDKNSELWFVADFDRWGDQLSEIAKKCRQKNYNMAISNPCVELWFILHSEDVSILSDEIKQKYFENEKVSADRRFLEKRIIDLFGSYKKSSPDCSLFIPNTSEAIENSKKLIPDLTERWPNNLGTHIHLLVEKLIK